MTAPIERIRYYDGEYLRAFDFAAEQDYHVQMRRRLNMALHLSGIVEGLEVFADTEAGITQYSVLPGMAIDLYGREILVFAPAVLDDALLRTAKAAGSLGLWLRYTKTAETPPAVGYQSCNGSDEYTRWREGYELALQPTGTAPPADPPPIDAPSDDPDDGLGVQLGVLYLKYAGETLVIDKYDPAGRTYIGLRAQRILSSVDPAVGEFQVLEQQGPLTPPASLGVEPNLFAEQNLIVGDDFAVGDLQPQPQPVAPAVFPKASGNVKVAGDLFLQGELYSPRQVGAPAATKWLSLGEYVKTLVPDVITGKTNPLPIVAAASSTSGSATASIPLTSSFISNIDPGRVRIAASIAQFEMNPAFAYPASATAHLGVEVTSVSVSGGVCTFTLTCTGGPSVPSGTTQLTPWGSIVVSYVAVLYSL
jgi:hypothetical protein